MSDTYFRRSKASFSISKVQIMTDCWNSLGGGLFSKDRFAEIKKGNESSNKMMTTGTKVIGS